jgi:uncharacterized membrane protein YkoI
MVFALVAAAGTSMLLWNGFVRPGDARSAERHARDEEREVLDPHEYDRARTLKQAGAILSLEDILASARRHHDGRVLETELEQEGGRYIYEVELVDDQGQVWEMKFDASTAELLKDRREE